METITIGNKASQLHGYNDCRHEKVNKLGLRASNIFYLGQLERKVSVAKGKQ